MSAAAIAILNALVAASANAAGLAALYQTLRGDGTTPPREPTAEEWAKVDALDAAAKASYQAVIDAMPDDVKPTA